MQNILASNIREAKQELTLEEKQFATAKNNEDIQNLNIESPKIMKSSDKNIVFEQKQQQMHSSMKGLLSEKRKKEDGTQSDKTF